MPKKKPAAKPKQAISKVEQKKRQINANAASKTLAQQEREKAQLKQAKLEARVKTANDKEYSRIQIAMAKQVAREDALRDAQKKSKGRK